MPNVSNLVGGAAAALALAAALSCGKSSTGPSGTCTPSTSPTTLVVMNNAICPQAITITLGTQLTIINQDSQTHDMTSDPHPEHTDCPALNQIGFLNPNQSRTSGNLNTARRCGMHDHSNPNNNALKATITIQ